MDNEDVIKLLNELIQLDYDASKTYDEALEHVACTDSEVCIDLRAFRRDHVRHIAELSTMIENMGGTPIELSRDVKGLLLEGMTKLRSVTGTMGALKAMRMNEKLTNRSYEKAADNKLPLGIRDVVAANFEDEQRHVAAIESHIVRLAADTARDEVDDELLDDARIERQPDVRY
jgi:rubrerythrin